MPTYAYQCEACGHRFQRTMTLGDHERQKKPACPKCDSRKVKQRPVPFQVATESKA